MSSGQRVLLPAPGRTGDNRIVDATPVDAEVPTAERQGLGGGGGGGGGKARGEKERRHRHTVRDWDDVKDRVEELYLPDTSLEAVREAMKREYGFEARYVKTVS